MANLSGFSQPYSLTNDNIGRHVVEKTAGVYRLDKSRDGAFRTDYVGRSDNDLLGKLREWVGKYAYFSFQNFSVSKAAFEMECSIYHDLKPADNVTHPVVPTNIDCQCPESNCTSR